MTLRKPGLPWRHDPANLGSPLLLAGCIILRITWLHGPAKTCFQLAACSCELARLGTAHAALSTSPR